MEDVNAQRGKITNDYTIVMEDVNAQRGKITNDYTIVMEDVNAQRGKIPNTTETATDKFGLELRNKRGDTLIEWTISRKYKTINTMFQKQNRDEMDVKKPKRCSEDRN